jgi:hypothetical protein
MGIPLWMCWGRLDADIGVGRGREEQETLEEER